MGLHYLHPDNDLIKNTIDWNKAILIRRKRLFSPIKMRLSQIDWCWNQIKYQYSSDYLDILKQDYIQKYGTGGLSYNRFSLQVQVRGKGTNKVGLLILHTKICGNKQCISTRISIEDAVSLLMTQEIGNIEKMPYVKGLISKEIQDGVTQNVTKYLGRHSGIYHSDQGIGEIYGLDVVPHDDEYHGLQSRNRDMIQSMINCIKKYTKNQIQVHKVHEKD